MVLLDRELEYTYHAKQISRQRQAQGVRSGEGILVSELANFKAEVQFDKKDMVRNVMYSSHRCMLDSIFCGKTKGIESDTAE
jgi:hypothetical protein